jgi:hypothetical protein
MRQVFDDVSLSPWTDFIPLLLDAAESLFPPVMWRVARVAVVAGNTSSDGLRSAFISSSRRELSRRFVIGKNYWFVCYDAADSTHDGSGLRCDKAGYCDANMQGTPCRQHRPHPANGCESIPWGGYQQTERDVCSMCLCRFHRKRCERALRIYKTVLRNWRGCLPGHRPYGDGKQPVEPDATPIVASMAYSRAIALRRWRRLTGEDHSDLTLPGLPLTAITPARTASFAKFDGCGPCFVRFCLFVAPCPPAYDDWV